MKENMWRRPLIIKLFYSGNWELDYARRIIVALVIELAAPKDSFWARLKKAMMILAESTTHD